MTKEEAIADLKSIKATGMECIDYAIAVLEQLPSDDCVSRQAVNEYLEKLLDGRFDDFMSAAIIGIKDNINAMLPVTPTLPKGATNGDMIKAMFPYGKYGTNGNEVHVYGVGGNGCLVFTLDWWNAPYKRGNENG